VARPRNAAPASASWPSRVLVLLALAVAYVSLATAQDVTAPATTARAPADARGRELLNSERIAQRFGSYGIDVLESDGRVRVSNLFSERTGEKTCRTFAVVRYADAIAPAIAQEHGEIVAGGSIGAVFTAHGWRVGKTNLRYFEIEAPARVAELMRVATGTRLAAHAYALDVARDGQSYEYALLVEIHHPDYLGLADLETIYGDADAAGREPALALLVETATAKAQARN
jgi:hypothetical protein